MEVLLEKEFRRLLEILADLGSIGTELEKTADTVNLKASEEQLARQLVDHINFVRVPGYCAYQLTQEAITLLYLLAVKIHSLRLLYKEEGDSRKLKKLNQYEDAVNQAEPEIHRAIESLKPYSTLDGKKLVESIVSAYKSSLTSEST
jgi:hypothetical protein